MSAELYGARCTRCGSEILDGAARVCAVSGYSLPCARPEWLVELVELREQLAELRRKGRHGCIDAYCAREIVERIFWVEGHEPCASEHYDEIAAFGRAEYERGAREERARSEVESRERRECRMLLRRFVKYVTEDAATTPRTTRLVRLTNNTADYLARTQRSDDILRHDAPDGGEP